MDINVWFKRDLWLELPRKILGTFEPGGSSTYSSNAYVWDGWLKWPVSFVVTEKVMRFQGKNKDLNQLSQQIAQALQNDGYKVQSSSNTTPPGYLIQAQKAGILRDIITADRAFTISITGEPNDFTVKIGIGKWVQNIAVAAAEAILLSALFLAVDVPEMLWTVHIENTIAKKITEMIG